MSGVNSFYINYMYSIFSGSPGPLPYKIDQPKQGYKKIKQWTL
jgi:hypothetical protein